MNDDEKGAPPVEPAPPKEKKVDPPPPPPPASNDSLKKIARQYYLAEFLTSIGTNEGIELCELLANSGDIDDQGNFMLGSTVKTDKTALLKALSKIKSALSQNTATVTVATAPIDIPANSIHAPSMRELMGL